MHVAVTAVGADRPGIVAAVSKALFEHGGNIEDSRMAILGGHFSIMLIVATDADAQELETALTQQTEEFDLTVSVRPLADLEPGSSGGTPHVLNVYGADHPGIVYRVTQTLAEASVNVTDLATHVVDGTPPVYVMLLEVAVPAGADADALAAQLKTLAAELGVEISFRPAEADTL